jgi:hypothetical protein
MYIYIYANDIFIYISIYKKQIIVRRFAASLLPRCRSSYALNSSSPCGYSRSI